MWFRFSQFNISFLSDQIYEENLYNNFGPCGSYNLPGIPSAAEVKANGIDVGAMNAKLLQKIEELTLHLIRQQKEIEQLKKRK